MTLVVSDTGPINYLILIGNADLLGRLFDKVVIPSAVADELRHAGAPGEVRRWISATPPWIEVAGILEVDETLNLGRGEREAIALAERLKATGLLTDDFKARKAAEARGLQVTGTLGLLIVAAERGHIDLATAMRRLLQTNIRLNPAIIKEVMDRKTDPP